MTRDQFVKQAVRAAERAIMAPRGWFGSWRDITDGKGRRVVYRPGRQCWAVTYRGVKVSDHDSRSFAISKAGKLR